MLDFISQYIFNIVRMDMIIILSLVLVKPGHKTWRQWILRIIFYVVWATVVYFAAMSICYVVTKG